MADTPLNTGTEETSEAGAAPSEAGAVLDALHLHDQGYQGVEDGQSTEAFDGDGDGATTVLDNANLQTGRRQTFENVLEGLGDEGQAAGTGVEVIADDATPTETDNQVDAAFEAQQPVFNPQLPEFEETIEEEAVETFSLTPDPFETFDPDPIPFLGEDGDGTAAAEPPAAPEDVTLVAQADPEAPALEDPNTDEPPVAQTPSLSVQQAVGVEDEPLALNITAGLNDTDGAETLSIQITGVPEGFWFSNASGQPVGTSGGSGTWTFTPADIPTLHLQRPEHFSGSLNLTVVATAREVTGATASVSSPLPVFIEAVADTPELNAALATDYEDTWIALDVSSALVDRDGSEQLTVYITDVPPGASFNQGSEVTSPITLQDGTVIPVGAWMIPVGGPGNDGTLTGLSVLPPKDSDEDFSLTFVSVATEQSNGDQAVTSTVLPVTVIAVADAPDLSAVNVEGMENTWIPLTIDAALADRDGSEALTLYIDGLPPGAQLGLRQPDGSYLALDPSGQPAGPDGIPGSAVRIDLEGLDTPDGQWLAVLSPPDGATDFNLTVWAVSTEDANSDTAITSLTDPVTIHVDVWVNDPIVVAGAAQGNEDQWIALDLQAEIPTQDGTKEISVYLALPEGAEVAHVGGGAIAAVDPASLSGVPGATAGMVFYDVTAFLNPATGQVEGLQVRWDQDSLEHIDANIPFHLGAQVRDADVGGTTDTPGDQAWSWAAGTVVVDAVADAPQTLATQDSAGWENSWIPLTIDASLEDRDGSESLTVYLGGLPEGAQLGLVGPDGQWQPVTAFVPVPAGLGLPADALGLALEGLDISGPWLAVRPAENNSADFDLQVWAVSQEQAAEGRTIAEDGEYAVTGPQAIRVDVGVLAPVVAAADAVGQEYTPYNDGWTPIEISAAQTTPSAESPKEMRVFVELPQGAQVSHNGVLQTPLAADHLPPGATEGAQVFLITGSLEGLAVRWDPSQDAFNKGAIDYRVGAVVEDVDSGEAYDTPYPQDYSDANIAWASATVTVLGSADPADVASAAAGFEDQPIALNLTLTPQDSTELVTALRLEDLPAGSRLVTITEDGFEVLYTAPEGGGSHQVDLTPFTNPDGSLDLSALGIIAPEHSDGDFEISAFVTTTEPDSTSENATREHGPYAVPVAVTAIADAPVLVGHDTGGYEHGGGEGDHGIPVGIGELALVDADGSESLTVYIEGVPPGATLSLGQALTTETTLSGLSMEGSKTFPGNGTVWVITDPAQIAAISTLTITPPAGQAADIPLTVTAVTEEASNGDQAWSSVDVHVDVGVLAPVVDVAAQTGGFESAWTALNGLTASMAVEGSDKTLTVALIDLPAGVQVAYQAEGGAITLIAPEADGSVDVSSFWNSATGAIDGLVVRWNPETHPDDSTDISFRLRAHVVDVDAERARFDDLGSTPDALGVGVADERVSITDPITVGITPVVNTPTIAAANQGVEDQAFAVTPTITLTDATGSEALTGTVELVFSVADQAAGHLEWADGSPVPFRTEADGTRVYEIPHDHDAVAYDPDTQTYSLNGLMFVPTPNSDQDASYQIRVSVMDDGSVTETFTATGTIGVTAVADPMTITAGGSGREDGFQTSTGLYAGTIPLSVSIALTDLDGSEQLAPDEPVFLLSSDPAFIAGQVALNGETVTAKAVTGFDADGRPTFEPGEHLLQDGSPLFAWELPREVFSETTATTYGANGLTFAPAEHSDVDAAFTVRATVLDNDDSRKVSEGSGSVTIAAVADAPTLTVADAAGFEQATGDADYAGIAVPITSLTLHDTDGSESLTVYISGVPAGATLSLGEALGAGVTLSGVTMANDLTLPGDGSVWKIEVPNAEALAALSGLRVFPATGQSTDFTLTVTAVTTEAANGDQAWSQGAINIDVGVLTPEVAVTAPTAAYEDTWTTVNGLQARYAAPGSDDTVTITVRDLPDHAGLRHVDGGVLTPAADGSYDVTAYWNPETGAVDGLQVRWLDGSPQENSPDSITFTLRAHVIDADAGTARFDDLGQPFADVAFADVPVTVTIIPVADPATVESQAVGVEDKHIPLSFTITPTDSSEVINSLVLRDLPEGAELYHNGVLQTETAPGSGLYTLDPADLTGWTLLPPPDSNADFNLTLAVETKEPANGATLVQDHTIPVTVFGDADAPTGTTRADDNPMQEDQRFQVTWGTDISAALTDTDTSETLSFRITAEHPEARLFIDGVEQTPVDGVWTVSLADLSGDKVEIAGPQHWGSENNADRITFTVTAVSTEDDGHLDEGLLAGTGLTRAVEAQTVIGTLNLVIDPVADALIIEAANSGIEDQPGGIAVTPTITLIDTDGSESLHGTVYIVTSDPDLLNGVLKLGGDVLTPQEVTGFDALGNPTFGGDTPTGQFAYALPAAAFTLGAGHTYSIEGLVFEPVEHSDGDVDYTLYATSREAANGDMKVTTAAGTITVDAVADAVPLTTNDVAGMENTAIAFTVDTGLVDTDGSETLTVYITDVPTGAVIARNGETLSPMGGSVTLSNGTVLNGASTVAITITAGDNAAALLSGLTITPPTNDSADFALNLLAVTREASNGDEAISTASLFVDVGTEAPSLTVSNFTMLERTSYEDNWKVLSVNDLNAVVNAADGTENLVIYLWDFPAGMTVQAREINADGTLGSYKALSMDAEGKYTITAQQLGSVRIRTERHNDSDFEFKAQAMVRDVDVGTASDTPYTDPVAPDTAYSEVATIAVTVQARADRATLTGKGVGLEDEWFSFSTPLSATVLDANSETLTTLKLLNVPAGSEFQYDSTGNGDWVALPVVGGEVDLLGLTATQLASLQMKAPADSNVDFALTLRAITTESGSGDTPTVTRTTLTTDHTVSVTLFGNADKPVVTVDEVPKTIEEDALYKLSDAVTNPLLTDTDGSESLTLRITPQEPGVSRLAIDINTDGTIQPGEFVDLPASGYWEIPASQLGLVWVGGNANWASNTATPSLKFNVQAVATENDAALPSTGLAADLAALREGVALSDIQTVTLIVTPVADGFSIQAANSGLEDQDGGIAVTPQFTLLDADGSEALVGAVELTSSSAAMQAGTLSLNGVEIVPVDNGDGTFTWTLDATSFTLTGDTYTINGLVFVPEQHNATDISYTIKATVQDTHDNITLTTTGTGTIQVLAVADAPDVTLAGAEFMALEDTPLLVGLDAQLVDLDGSEVLSSAEISNVPEGWAVGYINGSGQWTSASNQGGGVWSLDTNRLDQVAVRPPSNLHIPVDEAPTFTVTVTASETEGDSQVAVRHASTVRTFSVWVDAVADTPNLVVNPAQTLEDTAVQLKIIPALADTDGSESLSVFISGDLLGGSFRTGSGQPVGTYDAETGRWAFDLSDLADLWFQPAPDSNEDVSLTVIARSDEGSNDSFAERTASLSISVKGVVDGVAEGNLTVLASEAKDSGSSPINLNLGALTSLDADGSESVAVVITDIPAGMTISMVNGFESHMRYIGNGRWAVEAGYLDKVQATVHKDFSGDLTLGLNVVVWENDGASQTFPKTLTLSVAPQADTPSVSLSASVMESHLLAENSGIPLSLTASPNDRYSANGIVAQEEITRVEFGFTDPAGKDLPEGVQMVLTLGEQTLTITKGETLVLEKTGQNADIFEAFFNEATGKVIIPADGSLQLVGLPKYWSWDVPVTVNATTTEINDPSQTATATTTGAVVITAEADALLAFDPASMPSYDQDNGYAYPDLSAGPAEFTLLTADQITFADQDGTETLYLMVENVPDGMSLSQGFKAGGGVWMVPVPTANGAVEAGWTLTVTATMAVTDYPLSLRWIVTDEDPDGGYDRAHLAVPVEITVTILDAEGNAGPGGDHALDPPVVDPSHLTLSLDPAWGVEDTAHSLSGYEWTLGAGVEVQSLIIRGLGPHTLTGQEGAYYNPVAEVWVVEPGFDLTQITVTPPQHASGTVTFEDVSVEVVASGADGTTYTSGPVTLVGLLQPDADGGVFTVTHTAPAAGMVEDPGEPIALSISLNRTDASEHLIVGEDGKTYVQISINHGTLLVDGNAVGQSTLYEIDPNGGWPIELTGLAVTLPDHFHGTVRVSLSVDFMDPAPAGDGFVADTTTSTSTYSLSIAARTDTPELTANAVSGSEDTLIALDLSAFNPDLVGAIHSYGSETMSVMVEGVPEGATLIGASNNGTYTVGGQTYSSWIIPASKIDSQTGEITGISLRPPLNWSGDMTLTLKAYAMEQSLGLAGMVEVSTDFTVTVTPVSDMPFLNPQNVTGFEDIGVPLALNAQVMDASETLTLTLSGVPDGASFTNAPENGQAVGTNVGGGVWTFTAAEIPGLHFVGPLHASGSFTLSVVATSQDGEAAPISTPAVTFTVALAGVADAVEPVFAFDTVIGAEDQGRSGDTLVPANGVALGISAELIDADETLVLILDDAPAGTLFWSDSGEEPKFIGASPEDGKWHIDQPYIAGLRMITPEDWNGSFTLSVTVRTLDGDSVAETVHSLAVEITPVNDAPVTELVTSALAYAGHRTAPITVVHGADGSGEAIAFADVDDTVLSRLEISIATGAQEGDSLGLIDSALGYDPLTGTVLLSVDGVEFAVSYSAATHTLVIEGTADHATYAKVAEKVVLTNGSGTLGAGDRGVTITAFDPEGASGSVTSTTTIGESGVTLGQNARGNLFWSEQDGGVLHGGAGDDLFFIDYGTSGTIDGSAGHDTLFILPGDHGTMGGWVQDELNPLAFTKANGEQTLSMLINLEEPVDFVINGSDLEFLNDHGASGSIEFEDGKIVTFSDLERVSF